MLYFRLAYIFKKPISEIRNWPASEILGWKTFFNLFGPMDWEREDMRDARRVWAQFGKAENAPEDYRIYPPPRIIDPLEKSISILRNLQAVNEAQGDAEKAENCAREIRRLKQESIINASRSRKNHV